MYICGKNVIKERISSGLKINKVYISNKFNDAEIYDLLKKKKIKYKIVSSRVLDEKVKEKHQNIIMEVDEVLTHDIDFIKTIKKERPIIVILDHIEDPHNFGAIIRTCEALGIDGIIIPNDRSVGINLTVVKTSAGTIYNMPIIRVANLQVAIKKLKEEGYWILGSDASGVDYLKMDYNMPICLVIGNEGKGMTEIIRKNCDYIIKIPMVGKVNSLNASVACGIILSRIVGNGDNYGK